MDEKIYSVTLADGSVIANLSMNGNNFISDEKITEDVFKNNCSPVVISDGENEESHENMDLVQITVAKDGKYWFVLRDLSAQELFEAKIRSDVEYIAMMTDVEL